MGVYRVGAEGYKNTVLVGKTGFPMKAQLVQREPARLAAWKNAGLYQRLQQLGKEANLPVFVLHDGPPYANGHIHIGTALNKVLKDMVIRSRSMDGYRVPYVPGWDTHGLPIELQAIKEASLNKHAATPLELRRRCREFAFRYIAIQKEEFQRLGVWGDWDNPYLTLHKEYEAKQIEIFGEMALKGFIYKGRKPVYWCTDCETALAEAEIEYYDHRSHSIYVAFPVTDGKSLLPEEKTSVVIWTTTPWTLPANLAIALHPDYIYALVQVGAEKYLTALELLPTVAAELGWQDPEVIGRWTGKELEGVVTRHPFIDRSSPLIMSEYVTLDAGTGCVHTAPGHGIEDYDVGQRYDLDVYAPVDDQGRFTGEAGKYSGLPVWEANELITADLKAGGYLLAHGSIMHQYPHCWRCKHPVIFRATDQWFASVENFRDQALEAIRRVQWIPKWGQERIGDMVAKRSDWCISRQRVWGVPIPIFYCERCGHHLITPETITAVADLFRREGSDAWYKYEAHEILPPGTKCPEASCGGTSFRKETDIMDVWFDSGSSHAAVCRQHPELRWPVDLYLEGSDQHRGWFQSSLLTSVAAYGQAPYKAVLTHGFTVDAEGRKMSKSLGNVIAPGDVINKYGADVLRLWVSSADYRGDISISENILEQMVEVYRRIRNTVRFLLANTSDFSPEKDRVPFEQMTALDRWALMQAERLHERVIKAYRTYDFHIVHQALHQFCVVDMGGFYLDVQKDRLYCDSPDSLRRRSAQTAMLDILLTLVQLMAPVLVFTADEIWEYLPEAVKEVESVHLCRWRPVETSRLHQDLEESWRQFFTMRKVAAKALERARNEKMIGSSNDAALHLYLGEAAFSAWQELAKTGEDASALFIVSQAHIHRAGESPADGIVEEDADAGVTAVVTPAAGHKCSRCWRYSETVEEEAAGGEGGDLCHRCREVLSRANMRSNASSV